MEDPEKILISMQDFVMALEECKKQQSFGVEEDELKNSLTGGLIPYSQEFMKIQQVG